MVFESSKPSDWGWQEYAIIAGCAVGLIAIVVAVIFFIVRRSRKAKAETYAQRVKNEPIQGWQTYQTVRAGSLVPQRESPTSSPESSPPSSPERPLLQQQQQQYGGVPYQIPPPPQAQAQAAQSQYGSVPSSPESQYGFLPESGNVYGSIPTGPIYSSTEVPFK